MHPAQITGHSSRSSGSRGLLLLVQSSKTLGGPEQVAEYTAVDLSPSGWIQLPNDKAD